jgi:uncharacterized repeat protein (TIGR01451 family)
MNSDARPAIAFRKFAPFFSFLWLAGLCFAATASAQRGLELSVTKEGTSAASYDGPITFTIGVQATGLITEIVTETITLTDTLPGGVDYVISSALWGCGIGAPGNPGSVVTATVPLGQTESLVCQTEMTNGDSAPLNISGTVNTQDAAVVTNTVRVAGTEGSDSASAGLRLNQSEPPIPTLNEWGMLVLLIGLAVSAVVYLRRRQPV